MAVRTDEEILHRIHNDDLFDDFFGTIHSDLVHYLPFELAKAFLIDTVKEENWKPNGREADDIKKQILDYMEFAWGKANNCRGLSAGRSINHMQAWLWMLGETNAATAIGVYSHYGKPQLRAICEHFGWDWKQWDDGSWRNNESDVGMPPRDAATLTWNT